MLALLKIYNFEQPFAFGWKYILWEIKEFSFLALLKSCVLPIFLSYGWNLHIGTICLTSGGWCFVILNKWAYLRMKHRCWGWAAMFDPRPPGLCLTSSSIWWRPPSGNSNSSKSPAESTAQRRAGLLWSLMQFHFLRYHSDMQRVKLCINSNVVPYSRLLNWIHGWIAAITELFGKPCSE